MQSEKLYTPAQLANADCTMAFLARLPKERQSMAVILANVFIAGMEAQERLTNQRPSPGG